MSSSTGSDEMPQEGPGPQVTARLGYLLKHAQARLTELTAAALAPCGIDGRELTVLLTLAECGPASQQQAAHRLGIDRTTMVALLDTLEAKGLVVRRPHESDRRKNVVEFTETGRDTLRKATEASDEAERRFLADLPEPAARRLRQALHTIVTGRP